MLRGLASLRCQIALRTIFVHFRAIEGDGFKSLAEGEEVEFELTEGPKGLQAESVKKSG